MGSFTDALENKLLDHVFGCGSRNYTPPTSIEVALSTTAINDDGTGITEPTDSSYSRVTTSASDWNAASNGTVTNATDITFPQASADWGTITYMALYAVYSDGTKEMIVYGALSTAKPVYANDTFQFPAGSITISLD